VESTGPRFLLGLQWHPERIDDDDHRRRILGAFTAAARETNHG
jgi:gamma-glutamyl-gamma-aminobutyrate hydrolase PuuD